MPGGRKSPDEYAASQAESWKGLASWGQDGADQMLRDAGTLWCIHRGVTLSVSVLNPCSLPQPDADAELLREKISDVTAILGLIKVAADPLGLAGAYFLSSLFEHFAERKRPGPGNADQAIQSPLKQIRAFDIGTFFPVKAVRPAMRLNHIIAAPSFQS